MERLETRLDGLVLLAPNVHGDARGFFAETFRADTARRHGIPTDFV
jgi:dTDP-4-dehydrorhamnose 3,5-epimerase